MAHLPQLNAEQVYRNYIDQSVLGLESFDLPGQKVGSGKGGGADSGTSVYRVRHRLSGQFYAMKVMQIHRDSFAKILAEIQVLERSHNENVVSFFGSFLYLVELRIFCEYMDAGSLDQVLRRVGRCEEPVARHICWKTLLALSYLRVELLTSHRDVKPSNILVNSRGQVKVCDFGSSRINADSFSESMAGSKYYAAPETFERKCCSKSDIWSLGITIIEIATGRFPFPICDDPPVSIRSPQFRPEPRQNIFRLDFHKMLEGEPPRLPHGYFTPQFEAFVGRCCVCKLHDRGGRDELLGHDWISLAQTDQVDMAAWATGTLLPQ